jgi:hypothetical protein
VELDGFLGKVTAKVTQWNLSKCVCRRKGNQNIIKGNFRIKTFAETSRRNRLHDEFMLSAFFTMFDME